MILCISSLVDVNMHMHTDGLAYCACSISCSHGVFFCNAVPLAHELLVNYLLIITYSCFDELTAQFEASSGVYGGKENNKSR